MNDSIFTGGGGPAQDQAQLLKLKYANRHGLIAGATGTGKTVTLQILAEGFSAAGVPVFLSDVKGDLAGLCQPGSAAAPMHANLMERAGTIGLDPYEYAAFPVTFWDMFGEKGHPVRTTVAEMGPLLLARLLELSEAQEGVLNIAFRVADEQGLALLDLKDLQALLVWVGENGSELSLRYGNVSRASVGTIQRRLLVLENQGGALLFGEPALNLDDMIARDADGRGRINVLASDRLMQAPGLYATFLLWLLSELFEQLPEVGDPDKPRFVFFFDEAHLLFDDAPDALIDKVEQVARLIRSKGVGVWFVTQNPDDIPPDILGQLGNRVQHALRAYTPRDQKGLRAAAETFRPNPRFDTEDAIREVGIGEAVTSYLQKKGVPGIAERTLIRPPSSRMGPITDAERGGVMAASALGAKYDVALDRESAFEILRKRAESAVEVEDDPVEAPTPDRSYRGSHSAPTSREYNSGRRYSPGSVKTGGSRSRSDSVAKTFGKSLARQLGTQMGRQITRGVLGGLFRGR